VTSSYWAAGIDRATVARSIAHSVPFGIYRGDEQVGFCRALTDQATFGYVLDVFVLEEHRGRGLALWLMQTVLAHPALRDLQRWRLASKDAQGLYAKVGFTPLAQPERLMERMDQNWPPGAERQEEQA
jgi:GNAT superfamily N-acetyltransferase